MITTESQSGSMVVSKEIIWMHVYAKVRVDIPYNALHSNSCKSKFHDRSLK